MSVEKPVRSPCTAVCALDDKDVCVGCYRTVGEITGWTKMDDAERRAVLERCRQRARVGNPFA